MAIKYTTFSEKDLGGGIDQQSSENLIGPGFVEDSLNADPTAEGPIEKRKGYVGYGGSLPVRVSAAEGFSNFGDRTITFKLDDSVNLTNVKSSPIIVRGKVSPEDSRFGSIIGPLDFIAGTEKIQYYPCFDCDPRKTILEGNNTYAIDKDETETTNSIAKFIGTTTSTSTTHSSNSVFIPDEIELDLVNGATTGDTVDITITNSTGSEFPAFFYYLDKPQEAGVNYVGSAAAASNPPSTPGTWTVGATTTATETILAGQHGILSVGKIIKVYKYDTFDWIQTEIIPDSIVVNAAGDVAITITNASAGSIEYIAVISSVPESSVVTGNKAIPGTLELTISDVTEFFPFIGAYVIDGTDRVGVLPDSVVTDAEAGTITITFTMGSYTGYEFEAYYEFGSITANTLTVEANEGAPQSSSGTDENPQLTIWGLPHSEIYGQNPPTDREGWTTHIDTYKSAGEEHLIAGVGGNLFREYPRSLGEVSYLMPELYPRISARTSGSATLGPIFQTTGDSSFRTDYIVDGYITADNISASENRLEIESATWISGNTVEYTFTSTNLLFFDSAEAAQTVDTAALNVLISTTTDQEDYLTITDMGHSRHIGEFKILQADVTGGEIVLRVDNPNIDSADYDEVDAGGKGGIFTGRFQFPTGDASENFLPGDELTGTIFSGTSAVVLQTSVGASFNVLIGGNISEQAVGTNFKLTAKRNTSVIPLRTFTGTADSTDFVKGDIISISGLTREVNVLSVNPNSNDAVTITGNSVTGIATVTGVADTFKFFVGQNITLMSAGAFTGTRPITNIVNSTTLEISSTSGDSGIAGTILGNAIEIDEVLEVEDAQNSTTAITVPIRWIPLEYPLDSFTGTPQTRGRYLDTKGYASQEIVRSTTVADTLYLTNNEDEVLKYDGVSIYRAGLPRWQGGLFITPDTGATGLIVPNTVPVAVASKVSDSEMTVSEGSENRFTSGDKVEVRDTGTGYSEIMTVNNTHVKGAAGHIQFTREFEDGTQFDGTAETITLVSFCNTYIRLNMIDRNNNLIGSAAVGSTDLSVDIGSPTGIHYKLLGLPLADIYDYDRLELEIYRSKLGTTTPFYRMATIPIDSDEGMGYTSYSDFRSDEDFPVLPDDGIHTAIAGSELGTAITEPPRAKYITSLNNRLILGNIKSYPVADLRIIRSTDKVDIASLEGKTIRLLNGPLSGPGTFMDYEFVDDSAAITLTPNLDIDSKPGTEGVIFNGTTTITAVGVTYLLVGDKVRFRVLAPNLLPPEIAADTDYWVVSTASTTTFEISTDPGAGAISLTDPGNAANVDYTARLAVDTGAAVTAGSWIYLYHDAPGEANTIQAAGWGHVPTQYTPDTNIAVFNHPYPGGNIPSTDVTRAIFAATSTSVPVFLGEDGNYNSFNGNAFGDDIDVIAARRLANAINASMRQFNTDATGFDDFVPFCTAGGGGDFNSGQVVITQSRIGNDLQITTPSYNSNDFLLFVNNTLVSGETTTVFKTTRFPSRIALSYQGFPEIFDSPYTSLDVDSESAIDINAADGQEITGMIPFFGDSAFGQGQKESTLIVFKTNSVYLVNIKSKSIEKLESMGLGCEAPFSPAPTKDGIIFANTSGLYRLTRQLKVQYIGQKLERLWTSLVDTDNIGLFTGHHNSQSQKYKLSFINKNSSITENSDVFTYDHTREYTGKSNFGSWTRYDNHNSTGWVNFGVDSFWGSTSGRVFKQRNTGEDSDYRDDAAPINMEVTLRAWDFGASAVRKAIGSIISHFRVISATIGTTIEAAVDLTTEFNVLDAFKVDSITDKILAFRSSLGKRKGKYLQLKYKNSTLDEPVTLSNVDVRVTGLSSKGIKEAADTTD